MSYADAKGREVQAPKARLGVHRVVVSVTISTAYIHHHTLHHPFLHSTAYGYLRRGSKSLDTIVLVDPTVGPYLRVRR